jgi:hypothetical protein
MHRRGYGTRCRSPGPTRLFTSSFSPASCRTGVVGVGLFDDFTHAKASISAAAVAPLIAAPVGASAVVAGSPDHPIDLTVSASFGETITLAELSIDGISLDCRIFVSGTAPAFTLSFLSAGQPVGDAVTTLVALRSASTRQSIDALLATDSAKAWLGRPIGSSSIRVGDVFSAAGSSPRATLHARRPRLADRQVSVQIAEALLAGALDLLVSTANPWFRSAAAAFSVFKTDGADGSEYG